MCILTFNCIQFPLTRHRERDYSQLLSHTHNFFNLQAEERQMDGHRQRIGTDQVRA